MLDGSKIKSINNIELFKANPTKHRPDQSSKAIRFCEYARNNTIAQAMDVKAHNK